MDTKDVISRLNAVRRYLEDREYVDMRVSTHIDAIFHAVSMLIEQDKIINRYQREDGEQK